MWASNPISSRGHSKENKCLCALEKFAERKPSEKHNLHLASLFHSALKERLRALNESQPCAS